MLCPVLFSSSRSRQHYISVSFVICWAIYHINSSLADRLILGSAQLSLEQKSNPLFSYKFFSLRSGLCQNSEKKNTLDDETKERGEEEKQ